MPEWLREVVLAVGAFFGGKAINAISEARKDRLQLRDSVTRLAIGVESISGDLRDIRGEIHKQVGELKMEIHDQVSGLKGELHQQQQNHDQRMLGMEGRIDGVNQRVDALASDNILIRKTAGQSDRLSWERTCRPTHPDEDDGGGG